MTGWRPDVLGDGFEQLTLELAPDDEGDVVATLVRYVPAADEPALPARTVLYLHGWSDYFFQAELARFWARQGAAFYALDLRKYGRSLREHQTPGYVDDLAVYDEDLDAALAVIEQTHGRYSRLMLMGHSTGGLTASLWADRHPGRISGLLLNSPWLELQGSSVVRTVSAPAIGRLARFQPKSPLPNIDPGFWGRVTSASSGGEWTYDEAWRPNPSFPVRAGWLAAIIAGHAAVARGLAIDVPVMYAASTRSLIRPRWSEQMREVDIVVDVEETTKRAIQLGPTVTVVRIAGGLHDLTLSPHPVRDHYYQQIARWLVGYGWV